MTTYGTLYGIGVGPGDPDLMTVKAVKTLAVVDRVFAASSTKNDASTALAIAQPHLAPKTDVVELGFPMTREQKELELAWTVNAQHVEAFLGTGQSAAFLTLGDPLLYSTFGYLLQTLTKKYPEIPVQIIPGVTSFQAAAARTKSILAESGQNLQVISGVCSEQKLRQLLNTSDNVVILKAYRNFPVIRKVLVELGLEKNSLLATRVGQDGEKIMTLDEAPEKPHYFSLILVKNLNHSA